MPTSKMIVGNFIFLKDPLRYNTYAKDKKLVPLGIMTCQIRYYNLARLHI
jgi:hypothetical protein